MANLVRYYSEPLAIDPAALARSDSGLLGMLMGAFAPDRKPYEIKGKVAVIDIRGPLEHHAGCFESYDGIKARMWEACSSEAETVLLSVDSPGGLVSGCFDCSTEIRAIADAGGKRLVAYVDGQSASAAYAIVCAADQIVIPEAGLCGSVGVIRSICESSVADKARGLTVTVVKSGPRKGDGNPDEPLSEAGLAEVQRIVDAQAEVFFDLVAKRRGLSADAVREWDGRQFVGADAVARGLADMVASEDELVAMLNGERAANEPPKGQEKTVEEDDLKKALQALAEGDDEEKAKRAKAALAALEGDAKSEEDEESPEDEKEDEDEKEGDAKAIASRALALAESTARAAIFAARPDIGAEARKALAAVPVDKLGAVVAAIPRPSPVTAHASAALGVQPTAPAGAPTRQLDAETQAIIDRSFPEVHRGVSHAEAGGHVSTMRPMSAEEARAFLQARK